MHTWVYSIWFQDFSADQKGFFIRMQIVGNVQKLNSCFIKLFGMILNTCQTHLSMHIESYWPVLQILNIDLQRVYTKKGGQRGGGKETYSI